MVLVLGAEEDEEEEEEEEEEEDEEEGEEKKEEGEEEERGVITELHTYTNTHNHTSAEGWEKPLQMDAGLG